MYVLLSGPALDFSVGPGFGCGIKPGIHGKNQDWISTKKLLHGSVHTKRNGYKIHRTGDTSHEIEVNFRDTPDYQNESKGLHGLLCLLHLHIG